MEHNNLHIVNNKNSPVCEDLRHEMKQGNVNVSEIDNGSRHPRARRVHSETGQVIIIDRLLSNHS